MSQKPANGTSETAATADVALPEGLHPDMKIMIDSREPVPAGASLEVQRAAWNTYAAKMRRPTPEGMTVEDRRIEFAGVSVPVRIYRPAGLPQPAPGLVYLHGGGWVKGDLDSSDSVAWGLADEVGAVVVSVEYRLAPEHPYPAALDDSYAAVSWTHENAADLGVDPARIAVTGDSAGGNLSAAVSIAARDRGGPPIAAQGLVYPVTGLPPKGGSYDSNAEAPGLTTASMRSYNAWYMPDPDTDDPLARPVMASDLSNLPPAFVHTATFDPLLDDGRTYADKLRAAGVETEYREAKGMIHGFLRARFFGEGARAEFDALAGWLRKKLG